MLQTVQQQPRNYHQQLISSNNCGGRSNYNLSLAHFYNDVHMDVTDYHKMGTAWKGGDSGTRVTWRGDKDNTSPNYLNAETIFDQQYYSDAGRHYGNEELYYRYAEKDQQQDIGGGFLGLSENIETEINNFLKERYFYDGNPAGLEYNACIAVKDLRHIIPLLILYCYRLKGDHFPKKVKGLWDKPPDDWPLDVPYFDPNNSPQRAKSGESGGSKPKKEVLVKMFNFLLQKYMDCRDLQSSATFPENGHQRATLGRLSDCRDQAGNHPKDFYPLQSDGTTFDIPINKSHLGSKTIPFRSLPTQSSLSSSSSSTSSSPLSSSPASPYLTHGFAYHSTGQDPHVLYQERSHHDFITSNTASAKPASFESQRADSTETNSLAWPSLPSHYHASNDLTHVMHPPSPQASTWLDQPNIDADHFTVPNMAMISSSPNFSPGPADTIPLCPRTNHSESRERKHSGQADQQPKFENYEEMVIDEEQPLKDKDIVEDNSEPADLQTGIGEEKRKPLKDIMTRIDTKLDYCSTEVSAARNFGILFVIKDLLWKMMTLIDSRQTVAYVEKLHELECTLDAVRIFKTMPESHFIKWQEFEAKWSLRVWTSL